MMRAFSNLVALDPRTLGKEFNNLQVFNKGLTLGATGGFIKLATSPDVIPVFSVCVLRAAAEALAYTMVKILEDKGATVTPLDFAIADKGFRKFIDEHAPKWRKGDTPAKQAYYKLWNAQNQGKFRLHVLGKEQFEELLENFHSKRNQRLMEAEMRFRTKLEHGQLAKVGEGLVYFEAEEIFNYG